MDSPLRCSRPGSFPPPGHSPWRNKQRARSPRWTRASPGRRTGTWIGGCSVVGSVRQLRAPFWLPKEWELALHRRHAGLYLDQGYPLTLEEEFVFALPAQAQPRSLPGVSENKTDPLHWRVEWATIGDGKLAARLHVELKRGQFSAAETPGLQQQLRELLAALAGGANWSAQP